ncbi:MAG: ATP-binding protein, partial [Desulfopila sp.]|nr:ATP-binding protein [Desulfopila sp.]
VYGELIGKPCYQVFHGQKEPCPTCPVSQPNLNKNVETATVYHSELKKTFEITSSPVLDDHGALLYLVHSAKDITTRLKDEETRSILSAAVQQTTESVVITDTTGKIRYVNPSYSNTTGYSRDELLGKKLDFLNINQNSAALFSEILQTVKGGKVWQGHLTSRKKDNTLLEENATISPIIQNTGQVSHFVAVKRDVTREKQLQKQLQQAMKMEAIGTLAGGIAHDFNNILSAMIGYGQIAKGKLKEDDPLREDIEQILQAGDRATNLVKQILTFSRRDTQENFHPLKLQYILKEVIKLLRSSFPATIELRPDIDDKCAAVQADPDQLHQLVMNLCTNAKQAIGGDYGSLRISLQEETVASPRILNGSITLPKGDYVYLAVSDNGPGMSKEVLARSFEPFFTTKPKGHGTGLGLSVVHGIVEKHGGIISIDSTPGIGTTIHIYFPAVRIHIETSTEEVELDSGGTERIMVVDDEMVLARMLEKMLSKLGYQVALFVDSLTAVREYRRNPHDFDLIITDMTMPHMTGAELSREILSLRPDLPIIMLTGYSESIDEEKAARLGITSFMLKPMKKNMLVKMVRKVLDDAKNACS